MPPQLQDCGAAPNTQSVSFISRLLAYLPGIVAGAADLDPAAVLTATVAGASFGYSLGWVVLLCIPVLLSVFFVASRIGGETRMGLVQLINQRFGRRGSLPIMLCMIVVNGAMIVGDVVAVSDSFGLILDLPRKFFLGLVGFIVWYVLIHGDFNQTTKTLGWMSLLLGAYVIAAFHVTSSVADLARGIVLPHLQGNADYFMGVTAVFGSLLTPDVIMWQTSTKRDLPPDVICAHKSESHAGTFVACLISLSAIICASHLKVQDPSSMTTRAAAAALAPLGYIGPILFSLGIIGSGLVALPILLASLSFSISEAFDWQSGLSKPPWEARFFYIVVTATIIIAVVTDQFRVNTVKVLYWSQVIAGLVLVPILIFIILLANDRRLMKTTNSRFENASLWAAVVGMAVSNIAFFWVELVR
ncbi:MAG: divalent metal cation transporter [Acidobacteriales bacterium]|nr:divalent metal cation transporter [Terriglobales bacterium]